MNIRYKILIIISVVFNVFGLLSVISIIVYEPPSDCDTMWPSLFGTPSECHHTDELLSDLLDRAIGWIPDKYLAWVGWYPTATLD